MGRKKKLIPEQDHSVFNFFQEKKEHSIQVRIGKSLLDKIDSYAKELQMTRSSIIIQALIEFASRIEGTREAKLQSDIGEMLEEMTKHIELVPNEKGGMSMQMVRPEIIHLDGEGGKR